MRPGDYLIGKKGVILEITPGVVRPHEAAPIEGTYVLIDESGESLDIAMWRYEGEELPELRMLGFRPFGYVLIRA
jgi:hypothetical protein